MTNRQALWARLPGEMRALPQWAVAGASKAPLSIDAQGRVFNTSVTSPSEWLTFEQAAQLAWDNRDKVTEHVKNGVTIRKTGYDIGFILNEADPFTCIDLDVKDVTTNPNEPHLWSTPEVFNWYWHIVQTFGSYTERSQSGKGLHIWLRANIGRGYRRDGVEIYSRERFIICTGDTVLPNAHPEDREMILMNMISQMPKEPESTKLVELEPEEDDWYVLNKALNASNGDKFLKLWCGEWQELGFPSQSEADLALMSMFTFYSESNSQCRALFRDSALGKRDKATKNDKYLNYTLTTIRARQAREQSADISGIVEAARLKKEQAALAVQELQGGAPAAHSGDMLAHSAPLSVQALHAANQGTPEHVQAPPEVTAASIAPVSAEAQEAGDTGLPWPPGFAGYIARFMYRSAARPVKEVAIVATLGLLSGICGKAWHIPGSGLNLYVILIARSAIGKEAMHSGISTIIKACSRENPMFHKFVDFTEYASGPALVKACVGNPCFVNVSGEWGRKLKRLATEDGRDGPLQTLRTQMTNLYQKSGPQSIVGGIGYSSQDNNVASVAGVSYSLIGETTPGTFYESLTESMMEDGFLSRFTVIEYDGKRPPGNPNMGIAPDDALKTTLNNMAVQADMLIAKDESHLLNITTEASQMLSAFELECDNRINSTDDESRRQMWNRAALKVLRIAGLLAVADNYLAPWITPEHIAWAKDVVMRDISIMRKRLDSGDVGSNDGARERKLVAIFKDYLTKEVGAGYKVPKGMQENSIIPRNYIQQRSTRSAAFYNHKLGVNRALDEAINTCIANGYIMEVQKDKVVEGYSFHGKAYRIIRLPDYEAESQN